MFEALKKLIEVPPMGAGEAGLTGRDWTRTARFHKPAQAPVAHDTPARGILPHAIDLSSGLAPETDPSPQPSRRTPCDLTEIKGVGPAAARDLSAAGITTFAELAGADPEDLLARLPGGRHSRTKLEGWIERAAEHARTA